MNIYLGNLSVEQIETEEQRSDDKAYIDEYEHAVSEINCDYADEHGLCEVLSDYTVNAYCTLTPCPHYKEKQE